MNKELIRKTMQPLLRNKYFIALLFFGVWMTFFDQNNIVERISVSQKIRRLEKEKTKLTEEIEQNKRKMKEIKGSKENLEKFAREEYLMKKENEVVFVIIE